MLLRRAQRIYKKRDKRYRERERDEKGLFWKRGVNLYSDKERSKRVKHFFLLESTGYFYFYIGFFIKVFNI